MQRRSFSLIDQKLSKLRGFEHGVRIYIADVQRRGFSLIYQLLSKWRGSELRRFWDILGYLYSTLSAALWYEAFVLGFWNFTQCKNIYCRCATSRFQFVRPKIVEMTGFELRRIWDILVYLYNTLSAALWYKAFALGFWNFTLWKNIYCRCATSRFQFDRPKNVEITGVWT